MISPRFDLLAHMGKSVSKKRAVAAALAANDEGVGARPSSQRGDAPGEAQGAGISIVPRRIENRSR